MIPASTLSHIARAIAPVREIESWYDTYRSTGPRYVWRRLREDARLAGKGADRGDAVYRSLWSAAAEELGAEVVELPDSFLEIRCGDVRTTVRHQVTELDPAPPLRLAGERPVVHELLSAAGIPVPEHVEFELGRLGPALELMRRVAAPCVVKPIGTGGGKGITAGITRPSELVRASLRASRLSRRLVIERQAFGDAYRMLVLDGELLDVVRHLAPRVVGDGRSTIAQLIAAENLRRLEARGYARRKVLKADLDSRLTLRRQGLNLRSVPAAGQTVQVKTVTNQNRLEDNETFRGPLSDELVATAVEAARLVGLRLAGIDVVTPDPSLPLARAGGVILEVNGTPGLDSHYLVADGARANAVCVPVLRKLLSVERCASAQLE